MGDSRVQKTSIINRIKDGTFKNDECSMGVSKQPYSTQAVPRNILAASYELSSVPENAEGTYEYEKVEVTYLYSRALRQVTINKTDSSGNPLEGAIFSVTKEDDPENIEDEGFYGEYTTDENGKIEISLPSGIYEIRELEAPEGYESNNNTQTITIDGNNENIEISFVNERKEGTVTVHHYLVGTNTPIADNETLTGYFGDDYYTSPITDLPEDTEVVDEYPDYYSGQFIDGNIEVIYYYRSSPKPYEIHYFYDGIENTSKTEYLEAICGIEISEYPDKNIPGYKLDRTENLPLVIRDNESLNIINVYYESEKTEYTVIKEWNLNNLGEEDNYRATFTLKKTVNEVT